MEVVATVRREKEVGQNDLNALVPSLLGSHRLPEICREHWQQEVFPWGIVKPTSGLLAREVWRENIRRQASVGFLSKR